MVLGDQFVPGYLTKVTVDGVDLDGFAAQAVLAFQKGDNDKAAFGSQYVTKIGGQITGTLTCAGHVGWSIIEGLWTAFTKAEVAMIFETHPDDITKNVSWALTTVMTAFTPGDADAPGAVDFSREADVSGAPVPTFPTP